MSTWLLIKLFFLFLYVGLSALLTYIIYKEQDQYYKPIYITEKEGEKEVKVNIHDKFDEYTKRDQPINILRLFIGILTLFWLKFIIDVILSLYLSIHLYNYSNKKNFKLSKEDVEYIRNKTIFLTKFFLVFAGAL